MLISRVCVKLINLKIFVCCVYIMPIICIFALRLMLTVFNKVFIMVNVFLVQCVDTDVFRRLACEGVKVDNFDCSSVVSTSYVCMSNHAAVNDCRKFNRNQADMRYFVHVVHCY